MLSKEEKKQLFEDHWVPAKTAESFSYAIQRWCEDYDSIRAGLLALQAKIEEDKVDGDPDLPTYAALRKYADGHARNATLATAVPVLLAILR